MPIYGLGNITPMFDSQNTAVAVGGTLNETALYSKVIPANILGLNGMLRINIHGTITNSANNKVVKIKIGSSSLLTVTLTTQAAFQYCRAFCNRNSASVNLSHYFGGSSAVAMTAYTLDMSADQTFTITGTTTLETGFTTTSMVRTNNVTTVVKSGHGLNSGEYVKISGAVAAGFNVDPVQITWIDANTFTYPNAGANDTASTQGTVQRYSVIQLEEISLEVLR